MKSAFRRGHGCARGTGLRIRPTRVFLLCLLLVWAALCQAAVAGTIQGTITDYDTGAPIANADVYVCNQVNYYEGVSGANGSYSITGVASGSGYTVCAWALDYAPDWVDGVSVSTGTVVLNFALTSEGPVYGGNLSCPYWYIEVDDYGYADWMIQTYPGQGEHENLSGDWAAAIRYDGIATSGGEAMWLTTDFICPYFTTDSTFHVVAPLTSWDDPANPTVGLDTGESKISNGVAEITISYRMEQTPAGTAAGLRPGGVGTASPTASGPYVLKVTYAIKNVSASTLANLALYQMLHPHPNDDYGPNNYAIYDPTPYAEGAFPEYHYRITEYGVSLWNPPGSDLTGFSAAVAPSAWGIGEFPGHTTEPAEGLHYNIYSDTLPGTVSGGPAEIAGAMKWSYGSLAPGASVSQTVLLWNGWQYAQVPMTAPGGGWFGARLGYGMTRYFLTGQLHAHWLHDSVLGVPLGGSDWTPDQLEREYRNRGYQWIAPTEHHDKRPATGSAGGLFEDPAVPGIWHLGDSMEDTAWRSHILGAAFDYGYLDWGEVGYEDLWDQTQYRAARLGNIRESAQGLAFVAHPHIASASYPFSSWSPRRLVELAGQYDGIEVFNGGLDAVGFSDAALALDSWTQVLSAGGYAYAVAGDDFAPNYGGAMDRGCVTAVVDLPYTTVVGKADVKAALRAGRFYASYAPWPVNWAGGAAYAPRIEGWWWEAGAGQAWVRVYSQLPVEVRFFTKRTRDSGEMASLTPVAGMEGSWDASYPGYYEDGWVRAEVRDSLGRVSLTQPIWLDRAQEVLGEWPTTGDKQGSGGLVVEIADAHLEVSGPQEGIPSVLGQLVAVPERPSPPPLGYVGFCYSFTPEAELSGENYLTISYRPADLGLCPESALGIYQYDEAAEEWVCLPSSLDMDAKTATAAVSSLGLFGLSAEVTEDTTAPEVAIAQPASGATISGATTVEAAVTDDNAVAGVRFYLDDVYLGRDTQGADGWSCPVDCASYANGEHAITAKAEDSFGNEAEDTIPVTISGGLPAPGLSISLPEAGTVFWNYVEASGGWSGTDPMVGGLLRVGDLPVVALTPGEGEWTAAGAVDWDLSGPYELIVEGRDAAGNRAQASVEVEFRSFSDIPRNFWARLYIYAIARAGIAQGSYGEYLPDLAVTRAQMAVYVARGLAGGDAGVPGGPATPHFGDVPAGYWAYKYVEYIYGLGIVGGYEDGYHPEEVVTRGAMAVYMARARAGGDSHIPAGPATPTFPDVPISYWAYKWIEYCHAHGVVGGYSDGYHPGETVNRAQMAVYEQRGFDLPM